MILRVILGCFGVGFGFVFGDFRWVWGIFGFKLRCCGFCWVCVCWTDFEFFDLTCSRVYGLGVKWFLGFIVLSFG